MSRNTFSNSRSEEKHFLWRWYCGKKKPNRNVVSRGLYSYRRVRFIALFPNIFFFVLFLHINAKGFKRKFRRVQAVICIIQRVHFQIRVVVFSCQDKDLFRYVWYCGKKTNRVWLSAVYTLIDDRRHHSGQNLLQTHPHYFDHIRFVKLTCMDTRDRFDLRDELHEKLKIFPRWRIRRIEGYRHRKALQESHKT